jgi:hypothetical protein
VFETGQILLATLGHPLFAALPQLDLRTKAPELFFCRSGGVEGRGLYTTEGFVVLAGSVAFVATKLEAFASRGGGDFLTSHDLEDVLNIVDGREEY